MIFGIILAAFGVFLLGCLVGDHDRNRVWREWNDNRVKEDEQAVDPEHVIFCNKCLCQFSLGTS